MQKSACLLVIASLFLVPLASPGTAQAIKIRYEITDLPDTTQGVDRWQYTYHVSDYTFKAGHGFTIFFDHALYKNIEAPPPPVSGDWDVIVWQPNIALPQDGAYDALSVTSKTDGASLGEPFIVRFVWRGNGKPGPQFFEVYQKEPFNRLESGQTIGGAFTFDLMVPEEIALIHIPLKVTAVGNRPMEIQTIGALYDALGGAENVNFIITRDPSTGTWRSYLGERSKGTSADRTITEDLGIITVMKNFVTLRLRGDALGRSGTSNVYLNRGTNLVGVPLKNERLKRVGDLLSLKGIKDSATAIIVSDKGTFKVIARPGDEGDIPITGGQSFIITARQAGVAEIRGVAWDNGNYSPCPPAA